MNVTSNLSLAVPSDETVQKEVSPYNRVCLHHPKQKRGVHDEDYVATYSWSAVTTGGNSSTSATTSRARSRRSPRSGRASPILAGPSNCRQRFEMYRQARTHRATICKNSVLAIKQMEVKR